MPLTIGFPHHAPGNFIALLPVAIVDYSIDIEVPRCFVCPEIDSKDRLGDAITVSRLGVAES